jgi:hypothetical protein
MPPWIYEALLPAGGRLKRPHVSFGHINSFDLTSPPG